MCRHCQTNYPPKLFHTLLQTKNMQNKLFSGMLLCSLYATVLLLVCFRICTKPNDDCFIRTHICITVQKTPGLTSWLNYTITKRNTVIHLHVAFKLLDIKKGKSQQNFLLIAVLEKMSLIWRALKFYTQHRDYQHYDTLTVWGSSSVNTSIRVIWQLATRHTNYSLDTDQTLPPS